MSGEREVGSVGEGGPAVGWQGVRRVGRTAVGALAKVKESSKGRWRRVKGAIEGQGLPLEHSCIMHTAAYFMHICWIAK